MADNPKNSHEVIRRVAEEKRVIAIGLDALKTVRQAINEAITKLNVHIVYDPSTPASFVDYLGAGAVGALQGAAAGATVGFFLGVATRHPAEGVGIGAVIGALLGALIAARQVQVGMACSGWLAP